MEGKGIVHERVARISQLPPEEVLSVLGTPHVGLDAAAVECRRESFGENRVAGQRRDTIRFRLRRAFINPFSVVLFVMAGISILTDLLSGGALQNNGTTVILILVMLLISGVVRFVQELRAKRTADELTGLINTTVAVRRSGDWNYLPGEELVVGDLIQLSAGDRVPADIRLIQARDCYVSQSGMTGESGIREKTPQALRGEPHSVGDYRNTLFMGTTISGGSCRGVVLAVGEDTAYGGVPSTGPGRKAGFDRGANSIAWVLIKFMMLLIPVVFVAGGLTKGEWLTAFLFAMSVAVGLTPELLPMVITACMVRGSNCMSKKQTVVKNINAMQEFGSMDVLCVDKTGTLTGDTLLLEYYMDILGNESMRVLDYAYLNSVYHTSAANFLDGAIVRAETMPGQEAHFRQLRERFRKLDEVPFDYQRKSAGVLLTDGQQRYIIVKGDVDRVVSRCTYALYGTEHIRIRPELLDSVHAVVDEMMEDGMKVIAVAACQTQREVITAEDEADLTLLGYLAFFDAPKQSAASAIRKLRDRKITVKVLTGDHASVAESVCRRLNIPVKGLLTGPELAKLSEDELGPVVEQTQVFAELTPGQKEQLVAVLQQGGHCVGFLGDGMNDLPAVLQADVGISVDTACESVKEAADVILMKKDLNVLEEGVLEGRRAFANMVKYIKITASSNFGNICAVVVASVCLPFFPMTSLQLLLLNLLYDILCLVLPWDRVDEETYSKPLEWSGRTLPRFMLYFGGISTLFDLVTFAFLFWGLCPILCGGPFAALSGAGQLQFIAVFQTGWFLESMWTQVLILQLLRTRRIPFLQSRPSAPVVLVTLIGIAAFTLLAMTPVGGLLGMTALPAAYFLFLTGVVLCYLVLVTCAKQIYMRQFGTLL